MKTTQLLRRLAAVVRHLLPVATSLACTGLALSERDAVAETAAGTAFAQANNAFACDLYRAIGARSEGDLFFSPASVTSILSLVTAGAADDTAREMRQALHLPEDIRPLAREYAAIFAAAKRSSDTTRVELTSANALWLQNEFHLQDAFLALAKQEYDAEVRGIDFLHTPESAAHEINRWVEQKTNQRIKNLVAPSMLNALTKLVLTNVIYFKAPWLHHFTRAATTDQSFFSEHGSDRKVPMMRLVESSRYGEDKDVQLLELPYGMGSLSMIIALPQKGSTLAQLEQSLSAAKLASWDAELVRKRVDISLPRFRIEGSYSLRETLEKLGIKLAFDPEHADFSALVASKLFAISAVIHKSFIAVDEEGTEAAAATAVIMAAGAAAPPPEKPVVFRADHPFLFFIRDEDSKTILFLGRFTGR